MHTQFSYISLAKPLSPIHSVGCTANPSTARSMPDESRIVFGRDKQTLQSTICSMANSICVLHPWEALELEKNRITPACRNHKHIKRLEAMQLTARGDNVHDSAAAKWIGPSKICMTIQATWVVKQSGHAGPLVLQLA